MKKERDAWLDNAKGVLILMVVAGHMIGSLYDNADWVKSLYFCINSSHMLLFTFLTGYLQKRRVTNREYGNLVNRLLLPYFILQAIYYLIICVESIFTGRGNYGQTLTHIEWFSPIYLLWFLCTIFICSVVTSLLPCKKHPYLVLSIAFLISWISILLPEISYLILTKTIAYFPIYLLGYLFEKEYMMKLRNSIPIRIVSIFIVAGWWFSIVHFRPYIYKNIFALATSYWKYPEEFQGIYGLVARPIFMILGMIFSFAFLAIMPRKKGIFTKLGQQSMYVFALHGAVVLIVRMINSYVYAFYPKINSPKEYILFGILIVMLTYFLGSDFVAKIFKKILEPNVDWSKYKIVKREE